MDKVTADFTRVGTSSTDPFRPGKRWEHVEYRVTLRYQGRQFTTPYYVGMAHDEPTAENVLYALLSDSSGADNAETFEDYASEFADLDELSYRDAEDLRATYSAVKRQAVGVRRLLGDVYDGAVFPSGDDDHETIAARLTA